MTGFTDEHHATFRDIIEKLGDLLITHREDLATLDDSVNTTDDPLLPPDSADQTSSSNLPDVIEGTIDTVKGHLAAATFSYCQDNWSDLKKALIC